MTNSIDEMAIVLRTILLMSLGFWVGYKYNARKSK